MLPIHRAETNLAASCRCAIVLPATESPVTFDEAITQTLSMLQRNGRVSFRALKRQFSCDDAYLDDLRHELVDVLRLAVVEGEAILVLSGVPPAAPAPLPAQEAPPTGTPEGERRHLPTMFCDLADSTGLAGLLDPEELGELYRSWQETYVAVIASHGGAVANYLGDGALIFFGYPVSHEDSADSAIRAALEIQAAWVARQPAWASRHGVTVAARIGIHYGLVLLTDLGGQFGRQQFSIGETPNIAARLQSLAGPGEVVISQQMRAVLRREIPCDAMGEQSLKGVTRPIATFRLRSADSAQPQAPARHRMSRMIGRAAELAELQTCLTQAVRGPGQIIQVVGEPGIGKSRLIAELGTIGQLLGVQHATLHCADINSASTLHPVIEHLRRVVHAGADGQSGGAPDAIGRLDASMRTVLGDGCDDAVALIAHLLSLPGAVAPAGSPGQIRSRSFDVLVEWMVRTAAPSGLLLVVENLHWCDPSTTELLGRLVDRIAETRILLIGTSRPESPIPWARAAFRQIFLRRLSRQDTEAMIASATGGKTLPAVVTKAIAARGEGVPLFTEELIVTLLASGVMRDAGDRYELDAPLSALPSLETVQGSLTARLDRVGDARETAQVAAAVGREFSYEFLAALAFADAETLDRHVRTLTAAGLLEESGREPDMRYRFRHALIQEAAYDVMLRPRRQHIHRRIAAVLTGSFAEMTESEPEFAAHHCTEAGLIEDGVRLWRLAGERALNRGAGTEAQRHFERALGLLDRLDPGPGRLAQNLTLQVALGSALLLTKGQASDEVGAAFQAAYELSERVEEDSRDPAEVLPVLYGLWRFLLGRARLSDGLEVAERFLGLASRSCPPLCAVGHLAVGLTLYNMNRLPEALPRLDTGIALHEAGPDQHEYRTAIHMLGQDPYMIGLLTRAVTCWLLGRGDQALEDAGRAMAFAGASGNKLNEAVANAWIAKLQKLRRDQATLAATAERGVRLCGEHGFTMWLGACQALFGAARAASGDPEAGLLLIREGSRMMEGTGSPLFRLRNLGLAAEACLHAGALAEGLATVREAIATAASHGERWWLPEMHRLEGDLLLASGADRSAEAQACYRMAMELAANDGVQAIRLRAATDLARLMSVAGRGEEAMDYLHQALDALSPGWDGHDRAQARLLFAELVAKQDHPAARAAR